MSLFSLINNVLKNVQFAFLDFSGTHETSEVDECRTLGRKRLFVDFSFEKKRQKITPTHSRTRKELRTAKKDCVNLQRQVWRLQKQIKRLKSNSGESPKEDRNTRNYSATKTTTPRAHRLTTPLKRTHDLMREQGVSPRKYPRIKKCLSLAEVFLSDGAINSSECSKSKIAISKLGRFASVRGGTYSGQFSKAIAVATIHKRQAMLKKKHVQAFLCRLDNATCLPGKRTA